MKALLFIICIGHFVPVQAQKNASLNTTGDIADLIDSKYDNPRGKIHAAYAWVTSNIHYSKDSSLIINRGMGPQARIDVALKRRKGVCENFSAIFSAICNHLGFTAVVIEGYTRQHGSLDYAGHSWSAVLFENDWYLFDPTWDVGKSSGFRYFMRSGSDFINDHIPFDPIWQMLEYPYLFNDFDRGNQRSKKAIFHYRDSIAHYLESDSLARYLAAERRISKGKVMNQSSREYLKLVKSRLEEVRQQDQIEWYNAAITLMNEVSHGLNAFIEFRNQQFSPAKADSELKKILSEVENKLRQASALLDSVDISPATLLYGTGPARDHLNQLKHAYEQLTKILNQYLEKKSVISDQ